MSTSIDAASLPKYRQFAEQLRLQIADGVLKPGDRVPSRAQTYAQYQVSQTTLERAHGILEREGLIVREQGRGTFVAMPAPRTPTHFVGFHSSQSSAPYWAHLARGVHQAAERTQKQLLLLKSDSKADDWDQVDGVLIATMRPQSSLRRLKANSPCISLLLEVTNVTSVVANDEGGIRAALEHLLALGHRRIAYLSEGNNPLSTRRRDAYDKTLRAAGIEPSPRWMRRMNRSEEPGFVTKGRLHMERWLQEDWSEEGCTALLAQNDETAIGVLQALRAADLRVPDDVSVVGFDGTETSLLCTPRLTTIEVPLVEIARRGFELLLAQINDPTTSRETLVLPTQLKVRESSAPPRIDSKNR